MLDANDEEDEKYEEIVKEHAIVHAMIKEG